MTSYRIDVRTPGSPGWLRFVSFASEDEAYARAIELNEDRILYAQVRVIKVDEVILDTFGKDYEAPA
jgi:hypothetical protein